MLIALLNHINFLSIIEFDVSENGTTVLYTNTLKVYVKDVLTVLALEGFQCTV